MYLSLLHFELDLDPNISIPQKEKVLRSLREKLKCKFSNRIIVKVDGDKNGYHISFFEESFECCQSQIEMILVYAESTGESRIKNSIFQILSWFEDRFVETPYSTHCAESETYTKKNSFNRYKNKLIVYSKEEDDLSVYPTFKGNVPKNTLGK